jgi:hypothetical protein
VLIAAASPLRKVLANASSSETLVQDISSIGLPPPSLKRAQDFVRLENSTSWEQYVVELHHLPSFLEELKVLDPRGTYLCETKPETYNGIDVWAFQRYFVSWGAAKELIVDTPMLYLFAVDGGHMKNVFGGVCLAAVVATANFRIFPAAWAVVDSENEGNCVWFVETILSCFGGIEFVWMTDQGSALTCDALVELLDREDQLQSLCAKHVIKTLEVAKARGEIRGSMSGVRELIYRFARSRTREWGDRVLSELERKNPDVAAYLRERRDKIEAAFFLKGRRRGGRITSQLVESFFNMVRPFREQGLVEGIIWMCKKFQEIQLEERESLNRWQSKTYKGERIACLSRAVSGKFFEAVGCHDSAFRVDRLQRTELVLEGDVVKLADGSVRHIRISRPAVGGQMVIDCPCLTRQEFGYPCARATQLLLDGGWCTPGLPAGAVAEYISVETWKKQTAINIVVPPEPAWLRLFNKQNPAASLRKLLLEVQALALLPGRIPVPAGRPKLVKRLRKQLSSHFARLKSSTEKGDRKKKGKARVQPEGDDEVIAEDEDVPILSPEELSDEVDRGGVAAGGGPDACLTKEVGMPPSVAKSLSDLWVVENEARLTKREEAKCSACGETGHKWPKCRARNVELMLVNIGAMPLQPVLAPQPQVARVAGPSVTLEVLAADPGVPYVKLADKRIGEKNVKKSYEVRKRENVDTCVLCQAEVLHDEWRQYGMRCTWCRAGFVHFGCAKSRDWTCEECQAGGGDAE